MARRQSTFDRMTKGYLFKESMHLKKWDKRFFVLSEGGSMPDGSFGAPILGYYLEEQVAGLSSGESLDPRGTFPAPTGCAVPTDIREHSFALKVDGKVTVNLCAESEDEKLKWIAALNQRTSSSAGASRASDASPVKDK